jgi:hypothetical protein
MQIDSCVIRCLIDPEDELENRRIGRRILNSGRYGKLAISLQAMGEVAGVMAMDRDLSTYLEAMESLWRMIEGGSMRLTGFADGCALAEALSMLGADSRLTPGDALIVACALADDDCNGLITLDREILFSPHLTRMLGERGKRIVDPREVFIGRDDVLTAFKYIRPERITITSAQSPHHVRVDALP